MEKNYWFDWPLIPENEFWGYIFFIPYDISRSNSWIFTTWNHEHKCKDNGQQVAVGGIAKRALFFANLATCSSQRNDDGSEV